MTVLRNRLCGGRQICPHSRRRCQCSICKVQSPGPQSVTAAKTIYSTMAWRARKQQRREPEEDATKATVSVHANPLESVTGLPVQVSGVPGVSEGGMRGCEVFGIGSLCSLKK